MKAFEIGKILVSCLSRGDRRDVTCDAPLSWVLSDQCFGSEATLAKVREFQKYPKNSEQYRAAKMAIGGITVSARCIQRRDSKHVAYRNPLICIDIDKDDNPKMDDPGFKDALLNGLFKWQYVYAASLSCSGNGIYCIVYLSSNEDDDDFHAAFSALQEDFQAVGITIDRQCKDITRLRMASPYPVLIKPDDAEIVAYEKRNPVEIPEFHPTPIQTYVTGGNTKHDVFLVVMDRLITSGFTADSYDAWRNAAFALHGVPEGLELFGRISMQSSDYKGHSEVLSKWHDTDNSRFTTDSTYAYFFKIAKEKFGPGYWGDAIEKLNRSKAR